MGWRNPTHVINRRAWPDGVPRGVEVDRLRGGSRNHAALDRAIRCGRCRIAWEIVRCTPGDRYSLREIVTGDEDATRDERRGVSVWYRIALAAR